MSTLNKYFGLGKKSVEVIIKEETNAVLNEFPLNILQVHPAAQLHRDRGPHGGERPARARLGKVLLRAEKGHKGDSTTSHLLPLVRESFSVLTFLYGQLACKFYDSTTKGIAPCLA